MATRLHRLSPRAATTLLRAQLRGDLADAGRADAVRLRQGRFHRRRRPTSRAIFEDAADGTLFLDEIGELPLEMQAKLLRVLENGEYQRVGETQRRVARARVDRRHQPRPAPGGASEGAFRADLYHRLSVFTLSVPPLRELDEDKLAAAGALPQLLRRPGEAQPFELDDARDRALAALRLPGQRARAAQHRDPADDQVRRAALVGGGARARARRRSATPSAEFGPASDPATLIEQAHAPARARAAASTSTRC